DHAFARLESELAAHEIHLGRLRLFEREIRLSKIGAGVDHFLIEPEFVEMISEIVMMMNVVPGAAEIVGIGPGPGVSFLPFERKRPIDFFEGFYQVAVDFQTIEHVGFAEVEVRSPQKSEKGRAVLDADSRNRWPPGGFESVPQ